MRSRSPRSRSATARRPRWTGSPSRSRAARCSACSAPTARARRRRSRSSRATAAPTPARCGCSGSTRGATATSCGRASASCCRKAACIPGVKPLEALELFASYYDEPDDPERLLQPRGSRGLDADARAAHVGRPAAAALARARADRRAVAGVPRRADRGHGPARPRHHVDDDPRAARRGRDRVLTTHAMDEAEQLCDRVGIIDHGRLVACDTPKELTTHAAADETTFTTVSGLDGRRARGAARRSRSARCARSGPATTSSTPRRRPELLAAITAWLARTGRVAQRAARRSAIARGRVPPPHRRGPRREGTRRHDPRADPHRDAAHAAAGREPARDAGDPARDPRVLLVGRRGEHQLQGAGRLPRPGVLALGGHVERDGEPRHRHRVRAPLRRAEAARIDAAVARRAAHGEDAQRPRVRGASRRS